MSKFKKIRSVTLPLFKFASGVPKNVCFLGPMFIGKKIEDTKEAATLARVVDMEDGSEGQIICSTVLVGILTEEYPGESYVGKAFEITSNKVPDKGYNIITLDEISIPEEMEPAITAMRLAAASEKSGVVPNKVVTGQRTKQKAAA